MGRDRGKPAATHLVPHNDGCRARMTELMRADPTDKVRVEKSQARMTRDKEEKQASVV